MESDLKLPDHQDLVNFKAAFALSEPKSGTELDNSGLADALMKAPVVAITTANYTVEIQKHAYTFVCFFDPRSAAYKLNKEEFEKAAFETTKSSKGGGGGGDAAALHGIDLSFAAIDAARNSFLTDQEASELGHANQSPSSQSGSDTMFEFGLPNFTPIIFHLFANGVRLREYQGVVESSDMLMWLQRMLVGSSSGGSSGGGGGSGDVAAVVEQKRQKGTIFAALCAPSTSTLVNGDGSTSADAGMKSDAGVGANAPESAEGGAIVAPAVAKEAAFRNLSIARPDLMDFVILDTEALCISTLGPAASYGDVSFVHKKYVASANWTLVDSFTGLNKTTATIVYTELLGRFLSDVQAGSEVKQLTPDNSHVFLDRIQPVIIALFHPDASETKENSRLKRLMLKAASNLGRNNVQLTWADGK